MTTQSITYTVALASTLAFGLFACAGATEPEPDEQTETQSEALSACETCRRNGGGNACNARCGANSCVPRDTWTTVSTWECGFPYGFGNQNSAAPGRAKATCTSGCGQDRCTIWHYSNGRAQCTAGVPLDYSQNPW